MHNKKGQAAMEFLMTYGWAILAAIIAIGVLAYFGVFSPGKYTTGSTVVNPPFYANAWNINLTGVNVELRNNGGETLEIRNATITGTPSGVVCRGGEYRGNVSAGAIIATTVPCSGLVAGDSFKGDVAINYRKAGSSLDLTSTGTISEKVVA